MSESFQLRLTQPQADSLEELVRVTGLGKSEHIRRAVDYYLAGWRRDAAKSVQQPAPADPVKTPVRLGRPAPVSSQHDAAGLTVVIKDAGVLPAGPSRGDARNPVKVVRR